MILSHWHRAKKQDEMASYSALICNRKNMMTYLMTDHNVSYHLNLFCRVLHTQWHKNVSLSTLFTVPRHMVKKPNSFRTGSILKIDQSKTLYAMGIQCLPWHKSSVPPDFCLSKEEHANTLKYVSFHNSSKLDLFVRIPLAHVNIHLCLYLKSYKFGFGSSRNTKDFQVFPHAGDQMASCQCDQSSSLFWPSTFRAESTSMFLCKCPQRQDRVRSQH